MKFIKTRPVKNPTRGTDQSAGIDFFVPDDFENHLLYPNCQVNIPSGIKVKIPSCTALIAFNKSGIATKNQLQVGACVVDSDYQGEVHLNLYNRGTEPALIRAGMKLTQFVLVPVIFTELVELENEQDLYNGVLTERGEGAFGSTNK